MSKSYKAICLIPIIICLLLTCNGCTVGPDYSRPETTINPETTYINAQGHIQDEDDFEQVDNWWENFGDPTTTELVKLALENNYDLKAAAARVLQAEAALAETRGRQLPDVSYGMSRDRSQRSFNFGGRFTVLNTTWTQSIDVTYMVDLFGKLKRSERAAWDDLLAMEATNQALVNSIIAIVVKARIDISTLQQRLEFACSNIDSLNKTLEIVERRYSRGLAGPVEVRLARENLQSAKAQEPTIELSLAMAEHALDILVGRHPGTGQELPRTLPELPELEPVTVGIPAALLDRRPDVIAAEYALMSANERIGISIAQLYPDLTLRGSYGAGADTFEDIWQKYSETYSLLINLAQPIFKGGQLKAQIAAARARYEEQAANYTNVVLNAIKEVEDALVSEKYLQEQLIYARQQVREAIAAESLSRDRYQRGVERILTVLESEQRRRMAQEQLTILMGQLWTTRVNLYLALGGDWYIQENNKEQ